ncbi:MAG TPA: VOC family protein [Trebonia sp.]
MIGLSHAGISVPDIDAAIAWYTTVLGFHVLEGPFDIDDSSPTAAVARDIYGPRWHRMRQAHLAADDGAGIELFQFLEPEEAAAGPPFRYWHPGLFHVCVVSPDVGALAARIAEHGGRQTTQVHRPSPRYLLCYCQDPWGNAIEINDQPYTKAHG